MHETVLVYRPDIFAHKDNSDRHNLTKIMWTETMSVPKEILSFLRDNIPGQGQAQHPPFVLVQILHTIAENGNIS